MKKYKSEHSRAIYLTKAVVDTLKSDLTDEDISKGEFCIHLEINHITDKSGLFSDVWFTLDEFEQFIDRFKEVSKDNPETLEFRGRDLLCKENTVLSSSCMMCDERFDGDGKVLTFEGRTLWVHLDCYPEFIQSIERLIENHKEEIAANKL